MFSNRAHNFATALYEIAIEENKMQKYLDDVVFMKETLEANQDLVNLIFSNRLSRLSKTEIIGNIFNNQVDDIVLNFLKTIIHKRTIRSIFDISESFIKLATPYLNIEDLIVYSARPISKASLSQIAKLFEVKLAKKIYIFNQIDPSLIGGIKVAIDSLTLDYTIKNRMSLLKKQMLGGDNCV